MYNDLNVCELVVRVRVRACAGFKNFIYEFIVSVGRAACMCVCFLCFCGRVKLRSSLPAYRIRKTCVALENARAHIDVSPL